MDDALPSSSRRLKIAAVVALLVALAIVGLGIFSRRGSEQKLVDWTKDQSTPTVLVMKPNAEKAADPLVLPATIEALNSAPIYARTNGYVRSWSVDIGARVKAGQLLAVIEAPEVEQQLAAARADLQTAKANEQLATTTAKRWQALLKQDAVSKQETDQRTSDFAAKQAATNAAAAEVARLEALIGFTQITAPFSGVVTSRTIQIGQLVTAGSASALSLFTLSDIGRMRIYVAVPQAYSAEIHPGLHVPLSLPEYPGRRFDTELIRTANAVDQRSGTVLVELEADNKDMALKPGAYGQVQFPIAGAAGGVVIPASAVLFRSDGTSVATVDKQNKVMLHHIMIGRDMGDSLEVTTGLTADDQIIDSPPDGIESGDLVRISAPSQEGKGAPENGQG